MTKMTAIHICSKCDAQSAKWTGQCLECGAWGTMQAGTAPTKAAGKTAGAGPLVAASPITGFDRIQAEDARRLPTGFAELDRVFGGGIVRGSVTLLGGEPGIGKSTLALALAALTAGRGQRVIYVSGEESSAQVKLRADRLGLGTANLFFLGETDVDAIIATLEKERADFAVVDSVQTLTASELPSEAGAINQIRYAAARLVGFAKGKGVPVVIIGHVTKDGSVAGPKTLEHIVDTVLSFEGERGHQLRILHAAKNRFGSTDETGLFAMTGTGLTEISNPSAYLLEERRPGTPGSAVGCLMEGTRPMLVEIQALVRHMQFGYPTRRATGFDQARLEMLVAVLEKRGGINLSQHDVYVNVVGGLKAREPAADLAVVAALVSAFRDKPLPENSVVWGEIGLGGEVRSVLSADRRLHEAAALGLRQVITSLPRSGGAKTPAGLRVVATPTVREMVNCFSELSVTRNT